MAPQVDNLYFLILGVTAFFAVLVSVIVAIFAIKYRDDSGQKVGANIHGSIPLELGWSLIPFIIAMGIFAYSTSVFFQLVRPPAETLEIYSTGKRWMWRFQHTDGTREINALHVPLGRPVKVTFTSEDVLHDLYFPSFRIKADAIPGRYSSVWFEPNKVGEYHIFCAEYCGTKHSGMIGKVIVMEAHDYQQWLSGGTSEGSLAQKGQKLFQDLACVSCHVPDGTGRGPSFFYFSGVPTAGKTLEELEQAVRNEVKKIVDHGVTEEELRRIKAQVVASRVYERDSMFFQARQIGSLETSGYSYKTIDLMTEKFKAVTAEQVRAVAQKYLIDDALTVAYLDPQPVGPRKPAAPAAGVRHAQ